MKITALLFLIVPLFLAGCRNSDAQIIQVKVWDADFQVIQTIDDSITLASLKSIWEDRTSFTMPERPNFTHKVDIATADGSTRWLYHPDGYVTVLSTSAGTPIYRIAQPDRLREILIPVVEKQNSTVHDLLLDGTLSSCQTSRDEGSLSC